MSSFSEFVTEDRRLVILRLLNDQPGFSLNESVIQDALGRFAHVVSRDVVRADLSWLAEQNLVSTSVVAGRVWVATLTERGAEIATGRARHPGVKRPSPRGG